MCSENYNYKLEELINRLGKHGEEKRNLINQLLLVSLCVNLFLIALCFIMYFSDKETTETNMTSIIDTQISEKSDSSNNSSHNDDNNSHISDDTSLLNESDIMNNNDTSIGTMWKEEPYGFTAPTNIVNGGLSNFDGDYYYYGNTTLRSSNRYGSEIKILYDGPAYYINIVDDKIYFVSPSDNYAICRIKKDGTDFKIVYNHPCHELSYYKGILYFCCQEYDDKFYICSMDKNDLRIKRLCESNAWYMNVSQNGIIYYIDINNNNSLSSIRIDGTDQKVLFSDDKYYDLCVINNTILVSKNKDLRYLYCINPISLKQTQIRNSYTQNTNFSNNKLYFINEEQNLCCCDLDGSNYSIISDSENYNFISIIPELICCCNADNDSAVFILEDKYYE